MKSPDTEPEKLQQEKKINDSTARGQGQPVRPMCDGDRCDARVDMQKRQKAFLEGEVMCPESA